MSEDLAIQVENLTKIYKMYDRPVDMLKETLHPFKRRYSRDFYALRDVSFEVKKGETVGIIGRNGSGKSTLLKMITGVLSPSAGAVKVNGRISALLELGTGFNPELSGIDNIYFSGTINGLSKEEVDESLEKVLAFADIGDFVYQPVKTYSSGMFVRLAFAVAIHVKPEIFIVDEALSVGDAYFQKKCLKEFYRLRESGCSILFVSHESYAIRTICQRALYLQNGRRMGFGSSAEIVDQYIHDLESGARSKGEAAEPISGSDGQNEARPSPEEAAPQYHIYITSIRLTDAADQEITQISSGDDLFLKFTYQSTGDLPTKLSFVFNLYRHNGFYICGSTTLMDGLAPFTARRQGAVTVKFPSLPLLAGQYQFRVAVNDDGGLGTYAQVNPACEFKVIDRFEAAGLVHLARQWQIE